MSVTCGNCGMDLTNWPATAAAHQCAPTEPDKPSLKELSPWMPSATASITYLHGMDVQDYQLHLKIMMEHAATLRAIAAELGEIAAHVRNNSAWELEGAQRALRSALADRLAGKEGT